MATYRIGDLARLTCTFTNSSGVATDTTATVTVEAPDGTKTTPAPTHSGTGIYYVDVALTQGGPWSARFVGSGGVTAAQPDIVWVRHPEGEPS